MGVSPDVLNYMIGKGAVSIKLDGEATFRHVGNVSELEFTPEIEKLDHFSSMSGTKTKDRTVILQTGGTLRIVMEEITGENLQLALVGTRETNSGGDVDIAIMSLAELKGAVLFVGANDVGQKITANFLSVDFSSGSPLSFISDEWGNIEISAEVLAVAGDFGTITVTDPLASA